MNKLTKDELEQIRQSDKAHQMRIKNGDWVEYDCGRNRLLAHIEALELEISSLKKSKLKGKK